MLFDASSLVLAQHTDYVFRNMVGSDGLSGLLVNTIYKDADGYIWLGTDNGIDRFDGMRIKNYTFKDVGQTMKKRVNCITVTRNKLLFAGNGLGLWAEDSHSGVLSRRFDDKINFSVNALLTDGKTLYAGTDKGLYIIKGEQVIAKRIDNNAWTAQNRITDLFLDRTEQCLWLTTQDGLARYDIKRGNIKLFRQQNKNVDNYFRCLTKSKDEIYIGTMNQGLLVFNTRNHSFTKGPSVGSNVVSDISGDGKDMIYVGTDGNGVHFVSHSQKKVVRSFRHTPGDANSISSNSVYSILVDQKGMLWVGTYRTGLDYTLFHNNMFSVYKFSPEFTSANLTVNSVSINGTERLIGTRDGLFYINESTGRVRRFTSPQLTSNLVLSTIFYRGRFFIGTYGGGLMTLDPATQQLKSFGQGLSTGHVFCMKTDRKARLWIGTSEGLYCYNGQTNGLSKFDNTNSQLPEGSVYSIMFDSTGKGWVGSEQGMSIIDPVKDAIRADIFPEGFANKDKIRVIYEDSRHNVFIAREKGSLFMSNLTMDKFSNVTLPFLRADIDNSVLSIAEDRNHNLWIACSDGLFHMENIGVKAYDLFTFSDGLPSQTFTNNSTLLDKDGILWLGNSKGLVSVNPAMAVKEHKLSHNKVYITGVHVNGKDTEQFASLANGEGNITFFFSDMSFGSPNSAVYEYRLEGVDDDWHTAVATGQVSYYDLKAGTYTFHVRIPGNAKTETTAQITVRPFIAWWGWCLIVMAAAALSYLIIRHRKNEKQIQPTEVMPQTEDTMLQAEASEPIDNKTQKTLLSDKECEMFKRRITTYMEKERPYVNKNLKSSEFAAYVGIPLNSLSFVLNQYMHMSFNDFVNTYRVSEFKRKATDEPFSQLTLSAMAEECGFGSHASFFRAFKKITGITPNEYLRRINNEQY